MTKIEEEFYDRLQNVIEQSKDMSPEKRHSVTRHNKLKSLRSKLAKYQELQLEKLVTLKQMRLALDQEIRLTQR